MVVVAVTWAVRRMCDNLSRTRQLIQNCASSSLSKWPCVTDPETCEHDLLLPDGAGRGMPSLHGRLHQAQFVTLCILVHSSCHNDKTTQQTLLRALLKTRILYKAAATSAALLPGRPVWPCTQQNNRLPWDTCIRISVAMGWSGE
jgi:hypothetical protein